MNRGRYESRRFREGMNAEKQPTPAKGSGASRIHRETNSRWNRPDRAYLFKDVASPAIISDLPIKKVQYDGVCFTGDMAWSDEDGYFFVGELPKTISGKIRRVQFRKADK